MEKLIKRVELDDINCDGIGIDDLINALIKTKLKYESCPKIFIQARGSCDETCYLRVSGRREETDEEYEGRIRYEASEKTRNYQYIKAEAIKLGLIKE